MEKTTFSRHMIEDRTDRYVTIATKVGFGEVLYTSTYSDRDGRWKNRTIEEIAQSLEMKKSNVHKRISKILKEILQKEKNRVEK